MTSPTEELTCLLEVAENLSELRRDQAAGVEPFAADHHGKLLERPRALVFPKPRAAEGEQLRELTRGHQRGQVVARAETLLALSRRFSRTNRVLTERRARLLSAIAALYE